MRVEGSDLQRILADFKRDDRGGGGVMKRNEFLRAMDIAGLNCTDQLLDAAGCSVRDDHVHYEPFLRWLMEPKTPVRSSRVKLPPLARPTSKSGLEGLDMPAHIAANGVLTPTKVSRRGSDPSNPRLQRKASNSCPSLKGSREASKVVDHFPVQSCPVPGIGFREQASRVAQKTGVAGDLVDDLREVSIQALAHPSALAPWRSCHGIRFYQSDTVTRCLRLICSEPVPGLRGESYLDVFNALTSTGWEHYMFLFGGLVRDILRRKVGNDIDVTFSAPAAELAEICKAKGFKCTLEGDYILIGVETEREYLEGMVITHNGITPPENSDFSMNWVFYDFVNDVIIDKTGYSVAAIIANQLQIPCARDTWDRWLAIGGSRILFRYYKFLVRGFEYDTAEMAYIAGHLLEFWRTDADETVKIGSDTLRSLVSARDEAKFARLRQLVFISFDLVRNGAKVLPRKLERRHSFSQLSKALTQPTTNVAFLTASEWWHRGWMRVLNPTPQIL